MKQSRQKINLLMAVLLLVSLAACGQTDKTAESVESQNASNGTEAQNTSGDLADENTEGIEEEAKQDSKPESSERKISRTASGTKVQVDYSAYSRENSVKKADYTRISQAKINELAPSSSYGRIYPFAGEVLQASSEDGYSYTAGYRYGFADAGGEIVCDPVYDDISPLYYTDSVTGDRVYVSFYCLRKFEVHSYDPDNWDYDYDSFCAAASYDGSLVTDCIYDSAEAFPDGLLLENISDGICTFTIIDWEGQTLLTDKDLQLEPGTVLNNITWNRGDDIFLIDCSDYSEEYLINLSGQILAGPCTGFGWVQDGLFSAYRNQEAAVLDLEGNEIIEWGKYNTLQTSCGYIAGEIFDEESGSTYDFMDEKGNLIFSVEGGSYVSITGNLFMVDGTDGENVQIYDHKGNLLAESKGERQYLADDAPVLCLEDGNSTTLTNLITGKEAVIDAVGCMVSGIRIANDLDFSTDSSILEIMYEEPGTDPEEYKWHYTYLKTDTLETICDTGKYMIMDIDRTTGEEYLLSQEGSSYFLLDDNYMEKTRFSSYPEFYDGVSVVNDDFGCTICGADGNEIFYYPFVLNYDD